MIEKKMVLSQILMKLNQIQGYGKQFVMYNFSGHVDEFSYRLLSLETDFQNRKDNDELLSRSFYLENLTDDQYCDIMDELNQWIK